MYLIRFFSILFCCLAFSTAISAQDVEQCATDGYGYAATNIQWDNFVDVNFSNIKIEESEGDKYLYFDINIRRKQDWYNGEYTTVEPWDVEGPTLYSLNLFFDYDANVMSEVREDLSYYASGEFTANATSFPFFEGRYSFYQASGGVANFGYLKIGTIAIQLMNETMLARMNFEVPNDEYVHLVTYRWKILSGATGKTGIKLRLGQSDDATLCYSKSSNNQTIVEGSYTLMGICTTGNLDISVGGNVPEKPVISNLTGDALACQGESKSYSANVNDASATLSWKVKNGANADITSAAVEGGSISSTTTSTTFTWAGNAPVGVDSVCLIASNDAGTAEKCIAVTVNAKPTINLTADASGCAGEPIMLTATSGLGSYKWYQGTNLLTTTATNTYSPSLPTSGIDVKYKVEVTQNGCSAEAEKTVEIKPLPVADIDVMIAEGHTRANGKYGVGDRIVYTAKNANTTDYTYSWSDGEHVVAGREFEIPSATAERYDVELTVTGKAAGSCSATKTVSLTRDNNCGITNLVVAGTDGNQICREEALCRLTTNVTTVCDGNEVVGYALYKGNVKLDSVKITDNTKSHIFNAYEAGTYTVKVYTYAGMKTTDVTISLKNVNVDKVVATDVIPVSPTNPIARLTAEATNGTVNAWLWEPQNKITGNNAQQYATTSALGANTSFYVYGTDQNGCMSMDSTKVEISNNVLDVKILPEFTTICKKGSVTLTAKVEGGTEPYHYVWTNDSYTEGDNTQQSIRFRDPGSAIAGNTYTRVVTVTDASNPQRSGQAFVEIAVAADEEPVLDIVGDNPLCEKGTLTVNKIGGATPQSYTWYVLKSGGNMQTITGDVCAFDLPDRGRGDYKVWVKGNTANCSSDTAKATINLRVNGFDLAWNTEPSNYSLGADITAVAEATNGTTPYTYSWTPLQGGVMSGNATTNPNTYQVLGASKDTYKFKVTVTDGNACQKTIEKDVSATISGGLNLAVSGSSTQCLGGAIAMTANASGGTSPYTFKWYKPGNESAAYQTTLAGGTSDMLVRGGFSDGEKVVVRVTDHAGLNRYDTITVRTSSQEAPVITAGDDITIASNSATLLMGEVTYGTVTGWHWTPVADLASENESTKQYATTKSLTGPKTYTVYATNDNGCVSFPDEINVNVATENTFTVAINDPGTLCIGNKVNLVAALNPESVSIDSWEWIETSGQLTNGNTSSPLFDASNDGSSVVHLRVTGSVNGGPTITATNSRSLTVLNRIAPTLALQGLDVNNKICSKESLKVVSTNTPPVTLTTCEWYVDGVKQSTTGTTFKPEVADISIVNLRVHAQSNAGCPAVSDLEEEITVNPKPVLEWDAASSLVVAPGAEVKVQANITKETTGDYIYTWSHTNSSAGVSFTETPQGATPELFATSQANANAVAGKAYVFKAYVTDANGCKSGEINRTVSVDGDVLTVNLTSVYEGYCIGGAALLRAEVISTVAGTEYTYEWYKNGGVLAGVTGREYLVTSPATTDSYQVKVTAGSKTGESIVLNLVESSGTATSLTAVHQQIPTNTRTVLVATPVDNARMIAWQWSPEDKLASGESILAHPYTTLLDGPRTHTYTVYAVDENNCVTQPVNVNVQTVNANPGDADPEVFAKVIPEEMTICSGNELPLQTKVWGGSGTITYTWEPANELSASNIADPVFNDSHAMLSPDTYSYIVKVQRGSWLAYARTNIQVVNGTLPVLALDKTNSGNACAGGDIVMKVNNAGSVSIDKYIWYIDGVEDPAVTGNTYTWPSVTGETQHNVKVIAVTNGNCRSNMVEMDSLVKPAIQLNDLQRLDSCGQVILFANAGGNATYTWEITAGADQVIKQAGKTADTIYLKPKEDFTNTYLPYTVNVKVKPQNGGCEAKGEISGKLFFQPRVKLAEWTPDGEALSLPYIMAEKNTNVLVSVDANQAVTHYSALNAVATWTALGGGTLNNTTSTSATLAHITADDSVKITVKNKDNAACVAMDSIPVYLYPEAPALAVDTVDNSMVKIGLRLDRAEGSKYTIWSRKWDPYCLTTRFTGDQVYIKEPTGIGISSKLWKEPNMDTLEFYYATTERTIQGRTWESKVTSDTVGYYLFDVRYDAGISSDNYMALYFDFEQMGCPTTEELGNRIVKVNSNINSVDIYKFDYSQQITELSSWMDFGGTPLVTSPFQLKNDLRAVLIVPQGGSSKVLQYGVLPKRSFEIKRTNPDENINWIYLLPNKTHIMDINTLFATDFSDIYNVYKMDFENETTVLISNFGPPFGVVGDDGLPLKPLQVIWVELNSVGPTSIIWK